MKLLVETRIEAPIDRVFERIADVPRWPDMIGGIDSVEVLTPGPVAQGTRFRETRRMHGRVATEEMTVAEIAPPGRFVVTAQSHGASYLAVHTLRRDGEATVLALEFSGTPTRLSARLMTPLVWLMSGQLRTQLAADLADIKTAVERSD